MISDKVTKFSSRIKKNEWIFSFTFHCDLVLSGVGVSENLHMDGHLSHGIVHPRAWRGKQRTEGLVSASECVHMRLLSQTKHRHRPLRLPFTNSPPHFERLKTNSISIWLLEHWNGFDCRLLDITSQTFICVKLIIVWREDFKIRQSDLLMHMLWSGSGQSDKAAMSGHMCSI